MLGTRNMALAPQSIIVWLAGKLVHGYGFGLLANMVIGILGAVVGGYILPPLGFIPVSAAGDFIAATLGAVILLVVIGLFRRLT